MSGALRRNATVMELLRMRSSVTPDFTVTDPINRIFRPQPQSQAREYFRLSGFFKKVRECEIAPPFISSFSASSSSSSSSSAAAATARAAFSKIGFIGWYLGMVKSRPVLTKSITSSMIYVAADLSSQTMSLPSFESYDLVRTLRMGGYGLIVLGPSLHFWFNFVSKVFPKRDVITTFKKMAMGQLVYGPIMTVVFFSLNAFLQGETGSQIFARLERDYFRTLLSGVMYWPLCDFITFRFVPVHLQPLVSNSFSYLWTVYMTYMASLEKVDA